MRFYNKWKSAMLVAASLFCFNAAFAQDEAVWETAYSWKYDTTTKEVVESGGTAASVNGADDRVAYGNAGYKTLCLNGKVGNLKDTTPSANACHIDITLDKGLTAGDSIFVTAFRNKNAEGKNAYIYMAFSKGGSIDDNQNYPNIYSDATNADYDSDGNEPATIAYVVPDEAAGSKVITLTRGSKGGATNLFITEFVVKRQASDEEENFDIRVLSSSYAVSEGTEDDLLTIYTWVSIPEGESAFIGGAADSNGNVISGYKVSSIGWEGLEVLSPTLYLGDPQEKATYVAAKAGLDTLQIRIPKYYDNNGAELLPRLGSTLTYRLALFAEDASGNITSEKLTVAVSGSQTVDSAKVSFEVSTDPITLELKGSDTIKYSYEPAIYDWASAAAYTYGSYPNVFNNNVSVVRVDEETLAVFGFAPGTTSIDIEFSDTTFSIPVTVTPATFTVSTDTIKVQEGETAQIEFDYAPKSMTWKEAAQYAFNVVEAIVYMDNVSVARVDEDSLKVLGFYPGETELVIDLEDTAFVIPIVVTAKPEEVVEEGPTTDEIINGTWSAIKTYQFDNREESVYTSKTAMTYSDETVTVASTACNLGTGEFEGLAMQGANKFFFYNSGLYQGNGGGRKVCILDVEAGQRVVVECTDASLALATTDIATLDTENSGNGVFVYNITADGNLGLTMTRYFVIKSIKIEAKVKLMTVSSWVFDDREESVYTSKTAMTYSDETVTIASTACNLGTGEFEGLAMQGANKFFFYNGGLYQGNGGGRKVGIIGVEAGQIVTVETTDASFALATTGIATLDTEASGDGVFVYNVTADGNLGFTMTRYFVIKSIKVQAYVQQTATNWIFDDREESVYTAKTAMTYSDETVTVASTACNKGTGEFEGLAMQGANKFFFYNGGLYQGNGGGRKVCVLGVEAGSVLSIETTDASLALATTDVATLNSELSGDGVFVYDITADGNFAVTMTRYFVIKSIKLVAPKASLKTPEFNVVAHEDWEVAPVVLTCATDGATIYYQIDTEEAVAYTDTIQLSKSATLSAYSEKDGKTSKTVTKAVTAGYVSTPTATITSVAGTTRDVTLATAAKDAATITYFLNGATEGVVYTAPFTIADSTDIVAVATVGEFVSDTLKTTLAAGNEVQLGTVAYAVATIADSAKAAYFEAQNLKAITVTADQSSVLCTPTVQIGYIFTPLDDATNLLVASKAVKGVVANGATIDSLGVGSLQAWAINENYANSDTTLLWLKRPSNLVAERIYNFSRAAWGGHTSDLTVAISATVETISGTEYGTLTFDGMTSYTDEEGNVLNNATTEGFLVQTGTTWLKRGGYDGFYQMNSGGRCIALQNLESGSVVKFYGRTGNADFALTLVDNGVAEADVTSTTEGSVYTYNIVSSGTIALSMARYGYLDSIIVYSDPNTPKTPSISVESSNGANRYLSFACETAGTDIYYAIGQQKITETTETFGVPYLANDTTGGVEAVYDTLYYTTTKADTTIVWGDFEYYDPQYLVELSESAYVRAYAQFMGSNSPTAERFVGAGYVITLNAPVIKFVENTEAGKKFEITVDNSDLLEGNPQGIYYTVPGAEPVAYTEPFVVANDVYGWLTAACSVDGYEAKTAYRYVDARESYNETYVAVTAESESLPAEAADLELADIATLNASLDAAFKPSGRIYMHKLMHAGYNSLVVPFSLTTSNLASGAVKITDETGKSLERGTDYTIYQIKTSTAFATIADELAAGNLDHTGNIVANTQSYFIKVADALVGKELIFVSAENAQNLAINKVDLTKLADEGKWRVVNNSTFAPVVADVPVYVVNEAGDALVRCAAGTAIAPFSTAVIADEATTAATELIPLVGGATSIESINRDLEQGGLIFDMMGRRVLEPKAGKVYIQNGVKFMQR